MFLGNTQSSGDPVNTSLVMRVTHLSAPLRPPLKLVLRSLASAAPAAALLYALWSH
jgi:hypothetical protein